MKRNLQLLIFVFISVFYGCSEKIASLPDKPKSVADVQKNVAGKKFQTVSTGFYGAVSVNDKREVEWIDVKTEKGEYEKKAVEEEKNFAIEFINDTAAKIFIRDTAITGKYAIDDKAGQYDEVKEGIKIRLTYSDPNSGFGGGIFSEMTYTYVVAGSDAKKLLLQLPRTVNRRPVISLLEVK